MEEIDAAFAPLGLLACRVHTRLEAVQRVEGGGLSGAVLVTDDRSIDGLSLLRIIRSIDLELPCWLVADDADRRTLQEAFALRVTSVLTHRIGAGALTSALRRRLVGEPELNGN